METGEKDKVEYHLSLQCLWENLQRDYTGTTQSGFQYSDKEDGEGDGEENLFTKYVPLSAPSKETKCDPKRVINQMAKVIN